MVIDNIPIPETVQGPFRGAWKKGYLAGLAGAFLIDNPYKDILTIRGCVTFSRGFRIAWEAGFACGNPGRVCERKPR